MWYVCCTSSQTVDQGGTIAAPDCYCAAAEQSPLFSGCRAFRSVSDPHQSASQPSSGLHMSHVSAAAAPTEQTAVSMTCIKLSLTCSVQGTVLIQQGMRTVCCAVPVGTAQQY